MAFRPRISIRRLMAVVALAAAISALTVPAIEVYRAKEYHVHTGVDSRQTPSLASWGGIEPPFWPRYLRRLAGRPWLGQGPCGFVTGFDVDYCEFAHPEMRVEHAGQSAYQFAPEHFERLEEIRRERIGGAKR